MKRTLKIFSFLILIFLAAQSQAQSIVSDTSSVTVHKDWRIDELVRKQQEYNESVRKAAGRTMRGYRLLVLNTNSRDEAIAAKTKLYTYFPDLKSYIVYQTPFFKLKVGNFKTREEAQDYQNQLNNIFPKGVFIMSDTIEVRPEKENDD